MRNAEYSIVSVAYLESVGTLSWSLHTECKTSANLANKYDSEETPVQDDHNSKSVKNRHLLPFLEEIYPGWPKSSVTLRWFETLFK